MKKVDENSKFQKFRRGDKKPDTLSKQRKKSRYIEKESLIGDLPRWVQSSKAAMYLASRRQIRRHRQPAVNEEVLARA